MRTNIDIDDKLMAEAMKAGGFKTKKETVEAALAAFARQRQAYAKLRALRGKVDWDLDYDYKAMRQGTPPRKR
ncbi:MAG: type II toxin-antitoxin system VapB family antitoxin [Pseudomonadota bacterium]|jgi:Arc/MetJ family transcription regulator